MATPQSYFIPGVAGPPTFGIAPDGTPPAGAVALSYSALLAWQQSPNLVWSAALGYPVSPHLKRKAADFWLLFTAAERTAITLARRTNAVLDEGLLHAALLGTVDMTTPDARAWFGAIAAAGLLTPDRMAYVLAGVPPAP